MIFRHGFCIHFNAQWIRTIMFSRAHPGDPLNDAQIYSLLFNNAWEIAD